MEGGPPRHNTTRPTYPPLPSSYNLSSEPLLPYDVEGVSLTRELCTVIEETPEYIFRLQSFVAAQDALRQVGYVLEPLSNESLEGKKRCQGCGNQMSKILREEMRRLSKSKRITAGNDVKNRTSSSEKSHSPEKRNPPQEEGIGKITGAGIDSDAAKIVPKNTFPCKFHNGRVANKVWTCCEMHVSSKPCTGAQQHHPRLYAPGEIDRLWQFHATPPNSGMSLRRAVAIDCEMGIAASGDSELIRLTLIDYFSSSTLIDSLVYPAVPMQDYQTRFSGVTRRDMEVARRQGRCILGRDNARRAVWQYVGPGTFVVGHSANNDLAALRWIHDVVVDTYLIEGKALAIKKKSEEKGNQGEGGPDHHTMENPVKQRDDKDIGTDGKPAHKGNTVVAASEALEKLSLSPPPLKSIMASEAKQSQLQQGEKKKGPKEPGMLSLKRLSLTRLGREIQTARKKGHDSFEDALAARDLVHWWVVQD
ncbi:3'-5' exonuclease [Arthroderma uncinatum]|uniref:3'-5' exonuclease n=1 Tax=Arthroderma uncinatum TaxID=74035 RepID=UPI00144ADA22|nr:3'-5' exonuclease [Arthroderma uncinatum]KAF3492147.1 3'-5' exonuclease [Arthroderma uncinatum]